MAEIRKFIFNPFQENTYVIYDDTKECVIIDPGCYERFEKDELYNFIADNGLQPMHLLNTHCHLDHVMGNAFVSKSWHLKLEMHCDDLPTLNLGATSAGLYGIHGYEESPKPEVFLEEGGKVSFGNTELDIIFVPGHAPGHIAFVNRQDEYVVAGDVLFDGSIGRTDLPGGDFETLASSIREKMYALPDNYTVYCGHGPETTIGKEKQSNPFVKG